MTKKKKIKTGKKQGSGQQAGLPNRLKELLLPGRLLRLGIGLLLLAGFLAALVLLNRPVPGTVPTSASLKTYVPARVLSVLTDNARANDWSEGRRMGSQTLEVELLGGEYKGELLTGTNFMSAYANIEAKEGTRVIVRLDYDENGEPYIVSFVNYDRGLVICGFVLVFSLLLVVIGGKKGLMALRGLIFTVICLWFLLIPLLLRGIPPIPATVGFVAVSAAASLLLLTGFSRKTLCATLGCVGGVAAAGIFAAVVGTLTPLNGFNMSEAEELVLRASDQGLHISSLLVCGVLIAALGAVMDVAMSIASSCHELHALNPELTARQLFRSGMNIGRDAMGTMANTLILAFAGSALNMLILFQAYDYPFLQIINSEMMSIEILQGIAGSIGIILTVPLVAFISAHVLTLKRKRPCVYKHDSAK